MGIPPTIHAGPYVLSVTERELDGVDDAGCTIIDRQTIVIEPGLAPDRRAEVVLHEVLHVVWALSGIDAKIAEEHCVSRLAPHLLDVMRRNPLLVDFFTGAPADAF